MWKLSVANMRNIKVRSKKTINDTRVVQVFCVLCLTVTVIKSQNTTESQHLGESQSTSYLINNLSTTEIIYGYSSTEKLLNTTEIPSSQSYQTGQQEETNKVETDGMSDISTDSSSVFTSEIVSRGGDRGYSTANAVSRQTNTLITPTSDSYENSSDTLQTEKINTETDFMPTSMTKQEVTDFSTNVSVPTSTTSAGTSKETPDIQESQSETLDGEAVTTTITELTTYFKEEGKGNSTTDVISASSQEEATGEGTTVFFTEEEGSGEVASTVTESTAGTGASEQVAISVQYPTYHTSQTTYESTVQTDSTSFSSFTTSLPKEMTTASSVVSSTTEQAKGPSIFSSSLSSKAKQPLTSLSYTTAERESSSPSISTRKSITTDSTIFSSTMLSSTRKSLTSVSYTTMPNKSSSPSTLPRHSPTTESTTMFPTVISSTIEYLTSVPSTTSFDADSIPSTVGKQNPTTGESFAETTSSSRSPSTTAETKHSVLTDSASTSSHLSTTGKKTSGIDLSTKAEAITKVMTESTQDKRLTGQHTYTEEIPASVSALKGSSSANEVTVRTSIILSTEVPSVEKMSTTVHRIPPPPPDKPITVPETSNATDKIEAAVEVDIMDCSARLSNDSWKVYLTDEFTLKLTQLYQQLEGFQEVIVHRIRCGSVIADHTVVLRAGMLGTDEDEDKKRIRDALQNVSISIDGVPVPKGNVDAAVDDSKITRGEICLVVVCPTGYICNETTRSCTSKCNPEAGYCHGNGDCFHQDGFDAICRCYTGETHYYIGEQCEKRRDYWDRSTVLAVGIGTTVVIFVAAVVIIILCCVYSMTLRRKLSRPKVYKWYHREQDVEQDNEGFPFAARWSPVPSGASTLVARDGDIQMKEMKMRRHLQYITDSFKDTEEKTSEFSSEKGNDSHSSEGTSGVRSSAETKVILKKSSNGNSREDIKLCVNGSVSSNQWKQGSGFASWLRSFWLRREGRWQPGEVAY